MKTTQKIQEISFSDALQNGRQISCLAKQVNMFLL